jgi:hypothetical protein
VLLFKGEGVDIVDYAMPTMKAEKALKDLHNAFLERRYGHAADMALEAIRQASMAYVALKHAERQEATHP